MKSGCVHRMHSLFVYGVVYRAQKKGTSNGTLRSTTNPWKMATGTNCVPLTREMVGSVVSAVVAPPMLIGAKGPKTRSNNGAISRAVISRSTLYINATVPSSIPRTSLMSMLDNE